MVDFLDVRSNTFRRNFNSVEVCSLEYIHKLDISFDITEILMTISKEVVNMLLSFDFKDDSSCFCYMQAYERSKLI